VAVRAQIEIGVCEVEMGKYAEAVETLLAAYDPAFPDLNAFAEREAAYALARLDQAVKGDDAPHAKAEAIKLLTLGLQPPVPLDPLGEQQPADSTAFDDLLDRACQAAILARPLALRPIPSPLLRLSLPEPFENRDTVRVTAPVVADLPPVAPLRTPAP
jgi:hypothetical protein